MTGGGQRAVRGLSIRTGKTVSNLVLKAEGKRTAITIVRTISCTVCKNWEDRKHTYKCVNLAKRISKQTGGSVGSVIYHLLATCNMIL